MSKWVSVSAGRGKVVGGNGRTGFDQRHTRMISIHDHIRVISIYATRWEWVGELNPEQPHHLPLGQLEEFYSLFRRQLPQEIHRSSKPASTIAFAPPANGVGGQSTAVRSRNPADEGVEITRADTWLFVLPSDQVVAALDFNVRSNSFDAGLSPIVNLLEQCAYARLIIDDSPLEEHIATLARRVGAKESESKGEEDVEGIDVDKILPPERHQIVFVEHVGEAPPDDQIPKIPLDDKMIKDILYRPEPPIRPEFMEYKEPSGLNQTNHTLCAVTPYASLLYGQQAYVENSVFLTVVQAVGTAARFRKIWHEAHGLVRDFRKNYQENEVGTQDRDSLEFLVDDLGNLELDLSFSVEASADLGLLIPALRIESFHKALYASMELSERAQTVSRMFIRLDASIRSELTAIEIREKDRQERKRLRWGLAVTILSLIAIPIGFLGAFFGINAKEVDGTLSIFNMENYEYAYLAAGCLTLIPVISFLVLDGRAWLFDRRKEKKRKERLKKRRGDDRRRADLAN